MIYSQNSLNTFIQCPYKFFLKYKKSLTWRKDDDSDKEYYDSLECGLNFHLICERYFSKLPTGVTKDSEFYLWLERVKSLVPILPEVKYFPEFEIRCNFNGFILFSKLDLLKIEEKKLEIYDWKTENKVLSYKKANSRLQTIIYLFMVGENAKNLIGDDINLDQISIIYYQPNLNVEPIRISYSKEKHLEYKFFIEDILSKISKISDSDICVDKNNKHCNICEFNYYCNKKYIEFNT